MLYQPENNLLQDKHILVTGASDGIGREAALTYARFGAKLILLGRDTVRLQSVADEIQQVSGHAAMWHTFDFSHATPESSQTLVAQIAQQVPRLDGVLHNAGILGEIVPMSEIDPQVWRQVMQVNVDATFWLTQALLPLLLKSPQASLIFTTSSVGRVGRAGWGSYAVSKFATEGMMQVLADEYQGQSLRINCINPGGTRTKMRASAFPDENAQKLKTPADLMPLYLWLMGKDSAAENGKSFDAQPGRKAGPAE